MRRVMSQIRTKTTAAKAKVKKKPHGPGETWSASSQGRRVGSPAPAATAARIWIRGKFSLFLGASGTRGSGAGWLQALSYARKEIRFGHAGLHPCMDQREVLPRPDSPLHLLGDGEEESGGLHLGPV